MMTVIMQIFNFIILGFMICVPFLIYKFVRRIKHLETKVSQLEKTSDKK